MIRVVSLCSCVLALSAPALAQTAESQIDPSAASLIFEAAQTFDAQTRYVDAAESYEGYAEICLDLPTAVLEAGRPCSNVDRALARAFELRSALGELDHAEAAAASFAEHFVYAQPRLAIEIGYSLVRLYLVHRNPEAAGNALNRFESLHRDPSAAQMIVTDAMRAHIATELGQDVRAARRWRAVERRWAENHTTLISDGATTSQAAREAVAEGRLLRAEASVDRFMAIRGPGPQRRQSARRWWTQTLSPWLVRGRRRLALARVELERVYELGSPRHSVVAAARIGEMYGRVVELHSALEIDDELMRALTLTHGGEPNVGYENARHHLEACVDWASHHGVAQAWANRCEAGLHALDPYRYPIAAELHGSAAYHPATSYTASSSTAGVFPVR